MVQLNEDIIKRDLNEKENMMYVEKLKNLMQTIERFDNESDIEDYFDFVNRALEDIPNYFHAIIKQQTDPLLLSPTLRFSDPEGYRERFVEHDRNRRSKHILMTESINKINRLCQSFHLPEVFETGLDRELYSDRDEKKGVTEHMAMEDRALARRIALQYYNDVLSNGINHEQTLEDAEKSI